MKQVLLTGFLLWSVCLVGCGGSSDTSSDPTPSVSNIEQGRLHGLNIEGLSYQSGNVSGVTGINGTFQYETGQDISFNFGETTLGSTLGREDINVLELISTESELSTENINLLRFLLLLDSDENRRNGIQISVALQNQANMLTEVVFNDGDFEVFSQLFIEEIQSIEDRVITLASGESVETFINRLRICDVTGLYFGRYTGGFTGRNWFLITSSLEANNSNLSTGFAVADNDVVFGFAPAPALSIENQVNFDLFLTDDIGLFSSVIDEDGVMTDGVWNFLGFIGTYEANLLNMNPAAVSRYTGTFFDNGLISGFYSINVLPDNSAVGVFVEGNFLTSSNSDLEINSGEISGSFENNRLTVSGNGVDITIPTERVGFIEEITGTATIDNRTTTVPGSACFL